MVEQSLSARDAHWAKDKLKRKHEATVVLNYIDRRLAQVALPQDKRFVLNVDASWGSGKTFFLKGVKHELLEKGCVVAELNAWETDNTDDPMVPVLLAIQTALKSTSKELGLTSKEKYARTTRQIAEHGGKLVLHLGKGALKAVGRRYFADAIDNLPGFESGSILDDATDAVKVALEQSLEKSIEMLANASTEMLEKQLHTTREFKAAIADSLVQIGTVNPTKSMLYVLVDELDRCRPDYAIKLLERLKHIFDVAGLVFIVATDTGQLQHSIKVVYGSGFDSETYLSRFFDRRYHLRNADYVDLVTDQLGKVGMEGGLSIPPGYDTPAQFLSHVAAVVGCSARDLEQCIAKLIDFVVMWPHKALIECAYAWPLILLLHKNQSALTPEGVASGSMTNSPIVELLTRILVQFDGYNSEGRYQKTSSNMRELFLALHDARVLNFNEVHKQFNVERFGVMSWVGDRLSDELRRCHGGSYVSSRPPKTVLSGYIQHARSLDGFSG